MAKEMHKPDYIIKKRRSGHWYWGLTLFVLAILAITFALGIWTNQKRYRFSETAKQQLIQLEDDLQRSQSDSTRWQQQFEVEKTVNQKLRSQILALELRVNNQKKEIAAYTRIFDPQSITSGLQISSFTWEPSAQGGYHYRLILAQAKDQTRAIKGKYQLLLGGIDHTEVDEKQNKEINFNELENLTDKDRQFKFKYLIARKGQFHIPKDFTPKFVRVIVTSSGSKGKSILQDFSWEREAVAPPEEKTAENTAQEQPKAGQKTSQTTANEDSATQTSESDTKADTQKAS